jgi:uncharacterized protein (DUF2384 family)
MTTASMLRLAAHQHHQSDTPSPEDVAKIELAIDNKVLSMARAIFQGDESRVENWSNTPHDTLDRTAPIYLLDTIVGVDRVGKVLIDIAYGFSSG